uniref:Pre-mRNA-splicing factor SYF2 n=1 Tax=Anolis carolinensis TaxID=28377 RepID=H9GQZ2_ANOCA
INIVFLAHSLQLKEKKKDCVAKREDYEIVKLLEISAEDAEQFERKKKKKNPDLGFSDYAAAQLRQYHRLNKQIIPDLEKFENLLHGTHVSYKEGVERMVLDLEKQIQKHEKYSRRRFYNDDADTDYIRVWGPLDYINEWNVKFNKKAEWFSGKYTAEIKQNLERGTAI